MERTKSEVRNQIYLDLKEKRRLLASISPKLEMHSKLIREIEELEKKYKTL
jgi:hypothetical protein